MKDGKMTVTLKVSHQKWRFTIAYASIGALSFFGVREWPWLEERIKAFVLRGVSVSVSQ